MMLKPVETRYKGYRFRSRLEARWAVFFDALGLQWEYEPEGYDLGDAGWYLPDFWLPDVFGGCWVEIKPPGKSKPEERDKAAALAEQSGHPVIIYFGLLSTECLEDEWLTKYFKNGALNPPIQAEAFTGYHPPSDDLPGGDRAFQLEDNFLSEGLREQGYNAPDYDGTKESATKVLMVAVEYFRKEQGRRCPYYWNGWYLRDYGAGAGHLIMWMGLLQGSSEQRGRKLDRAIGKAAGARFEHGEQP